MWISKRHLSSRRLYRFFLVLPILVLVLACGKTAEIPTPIQAPSEAPPPAKAIESLEAGDSIHTLVYDGIERVYILHVPPNIDVGTPTPLVLAFHGLSLKAEDMARISGFNQQADDSGFIVAYPNGTGDKQSWNAGHCCGEAAKYQVDDVGFIGALIDEIGKMTSIDPKRIYATGFSNGAFMVYKLACELPDRIAAFGPIGATPMEDDLNTCKPARSVPIIHFHGTADTFNLYEGGTAATGLKFVSVDDAIAFWVEKNGCPMRPESSQVGNIEHDVYAPCAENSAVELFTIVDGAHAWPGGEAVSAQVGEPTMEISATPLMWEFFTAHPMP